MNSFACKAGRCVCRIAVLLLLCALLAGCRQDPYLKNHIEILNAEKRALEDQVYALEYDYERKCAELADAREKIDRLGGGTNNRRERLPGGSADPSAEESGDPPAIDLPTITPGEPFDPQIDWPEQEPLPVPGNEGANGASDSFGGGPQQPVSALRQLQPSDPRITHIHIDPLRTRGADFDQAPGDDGISLVVEPRNADDEFVPLAGPLSIVLLDYGRRDEGDAARLGRWELSASQVERLMTSNGPEQGIYLRLDWSDSSPTDSKLLVAVRYTTVDGRQVEARRDVFVTLPGQFSQRWTPRSSTRTADRRHERLHEEPAATDGASFEQRFDTQTPGPAGASPAAFHEISERRSAPERPAWRPYR